ncbi:MAG TPA: hypothetical protein PKL84_04855, partial [Candidatus Hydrogenedentes bacterium]|nr:hypothetical protein [Candidatus Hydrogenedentota bacterium]
GPPSKLEEGYDMVCGWKADRRDPWHKVIPSRVYNAVVGRLFGLPLRDLNSGFKAMRMELAKRLPLYGDMHRMMVVFAANMGGKIAEVPVLHHPRRYGRSKYGFRRFYEGIRDALAVWVITRLSRETEHLLERACMAAAVVAFTLAPFLLRGGSILSASLLVALALCAIFAWRIFHVAGQSLDAAHADPTRFIEHELM